MGVKNSNGMKKFQKSRNECSSLLQAGLKRKSIDYPETEVFEKLIEWSSKMKKIDEEDEERDEGESKSRPIENMVDILIIFAKTYLKVWSENSDLSKEKLERVILPTQVNDLLNRIKNLLNASPQKAKELYLDVFSTIYDIGMISLKITRLLQGKNDSYAVYCQAFEKCTLEYYENVEPTNKTCFVKLLEDKKVHPKDFIAAMGSSKFLSDISVHSELLENPSFNTLAEMIKKSIQESFDAEKIEKLTPEITKILEHGTLLQLCSNDEIFNSDTKQEFYASIQKKFCLMIKALIDYPEIFDAIMVVYENEDDENAEIE